MAEGEAIGPKEAGVGDQELIGLVFGFDDANAAIGAVPQVEVAFGVDRHAYRRRFCSIMFNGFCQIGSRTLRVSEKFGGQPLERAGLERGKVEPFSTAVDG